MIDDEIEVIKEKKRRRRNPLEPTAHELRYSASSQHQQYYIQKKGLEISPDLLVHYHIRAREAAAAAAKTWIRTNDYRPDDDLPLYSEEVDEVRYPCFYTDRKAAIRFLYFHIFCAPDKDVWHRKKLIPSIMHLLNIPKNSFTSIRTLLNDIVEAESFETYKKKTSGGRGALIHHGTIQAKLWVIALSFVEVLIHMASLTSNAAPNE